MTDITMPCAASPGRTFCASLWAGGVAMIAGCMGNLPVPDQGRFAPLESLQSSGEAVVRLYAAPLPGIAAIAIHPWFVVKRADSTTFHRWEVVETSAGPYGHVRRDLQPPTADVGAGGAYVLAELIGPAAEPVVAFIEERSPAYPCRGCYLYVPGPNSNTYAQWVLDNSGWRVVLPPAALGKDVAPLCQRKSPAPDCSSPSHRLR